MRLAALALLVPACIIDAPADGPGVVGSREDVTTVPGDYAGYRVVMPCANAWNDVGITGTGSVAVTGNDAISAAGQDLRTQVAPQAN